MKLESGDQLEQSNVDWIRSNIPEYESIWSIYIGHDGTGKPMKVSGLPEEGQKSRESFYQAHYTVLNSLLQMRDVLEEIDVYGNQLSDPKSYLKIQRQQTVFWACVGRIRDMFKVMDDALRLGGAALRKFEDSYQNRNNFLHGPLSAHTVEDGILLTPKIAGDDESRIVWRDKSLWSESSDMKFGVWHEQLREVFSEIITAVRSGLSLCLGRIKVNLSMHDAQIQEVYAAVDPKQVHYAYSGACCAYYIAGN